MKDLYIDIETYSSVDIGKAGAYAYAQSEDFEILLFAYKADDADTVVVDLMSGEMIPEEVRCALTDPEVTKHAYNAAFEWYCLSRYGIPTPIDQWHCTMIHGLYCGYPAGLKAIGEALGLPQEKQKLNTGAALIRYFCHPCRPTKTNGGRLRNLPRHDEERWTLFKEYNAQDVDAEYAIEQRLAMFPVPEEEWYAWHKDVMMNATGVCIDEDLVQGALHLDAAAKTRLMEELAAITGLANPNSRAQLLPWIQARRPDVADLIKDTVAALLEEESLPEDVRRVLEIRQQTGKTSVSKYAAMEAAKGSDGRVRGLLQFYGANRTGRWAGRLVQVQNLPRNYLGSLDAARRLVKRKNLSLMEAVYGNVPDTLSQLIRTAFIPSPGRKFIVSDFSAIEARVIAYLAGEVWAQEVFATHGKIYEATAAQMFRVPIESIAKGKENYALRQKGKVATLALGYQGGPKALIAMGALNMGIKEEELPEIVTMWRRANPMIEAMWHNVEEAALETVKTGWEQHTNYVTTRLETDLTYGLTFLTIELPSRRKLYYCQPTIGENRWGQRKSILYMGVDQTKKKWTRQETYGGKLTENITQAVARDCLSVTLNRVYAAGYKPVMHIHDEIVIDAAPEQRLDDVNAIFAKPMPWAPGLTLKGAGFESEYYMKD